MKPAMLLIPVIGYLLGNLNGAVLLSKLVAHDDVRRHGSGNAGFTNFFRNYGGAVSLLVMVIDALKTIAACLVGRLLGGDAVLHGVMLGAIGVTLGHDFPVFLGFKGGKGIVCGFTAALCLDWRIGLILFAVFVILYFSTKYVSLGSVVCAAIFLVGFWILYWGDALLMAGSLLIGGLAIFMHRENIVRLVHGSERKTEFFKGKDTQ